MFPSVTAAWNRFWGGSSSPASVSPCAPIAPRRTKTSLSNNLHRRIVVIDRYTATLAAETYTNADFEEVRDFFRLEFRPLQYAVTEL